MNKPKPQPKIRFAPEQAENLIVSFENITKEAHENHCLKNEDRGEMLRYIFELLADLKVLNCFTREQIERIRLAEGLLPDHIVIGDEQEHNVALSFEITMVRIKAQPIIQHLY